MAKGNDKLKIHLPSLQQDLSTNWEVLSEAIQTVMRRYQVPNAYEQLRDLTRGCDIDEIRLKTFIQSLAIPESTKQQLLNLTPGTYTGLAAQLVKAFS
jgi:adenylosuccinate lyase